VCARERSEDLSAHFVLLGEGPLRSRDLPFSPVPFFALFSFKVFGNKLENASTQIKAEDLRKQSTD
jgi:hypothetical protein